ncbi:MAG: preprotein translocase subunit YajC [Dictyoglomus sp. NZ13-RE01]|nr:MAG: preprotein translocase subunit YajC [Dictyoglomus sp. NZ13-RE01]
MDQNTGSLISLLIVWGVVIAIFYFIAIVPQRREEKRRQEMLESLKAGDKIVTKGGLIGQIVAVNKQTKILQVSFGKGIIIEMVREGVAYKLKE